MKRIALGSFCVLNLLCSIGFILLFLYGIVSIVFDSFSYIYDDFFYIFFYILFIFIALQRMLRVTNIFYVLDDNIFCLKFLTIKKRTKWYDFMTIGRGAVYSYQKEYKEIKYTDIVSIDFVIKKYVTKYIWKKKQIMIELKNGESILIIDTIFSKKQLRKIIKFIQNKNNNIEISDFVKKYLNLT